MDKISINLVPVLLFLISCGSMNNYNTKINWHMRNCDHPHIHPGDKIAIDEGILSPYIAECDDQCKKQVDCKDEQDQKSCITDLNICRYDCTEIKIKSRLVKKGELHSPRLVSKNFKHNENGLYTDGSYYQSCDSMNPYNNYHDMKYQYTRSKWQNDRDSCMDAAANQKCIMFTNCLKTRKQVYIICLKARGYKMAR